VSGGKELTPTTAKNAWPTVPEKYDLLRVAWGWTEFVVTMFPRTPGAAAAPAGVQLPGMPATAEVGGADE
jgi:hypothetical protein